MSKLERIQAAKARTPSDDELRYMMQNQFFFNKDYTKYLSKYYILQWQPDYCLKAIMRGNIYHQGIHYNVIFHGCTARQVKRASLTQPSCRVKLSFRDAKLRFDIAPVVLIKLYCNKTL